MYTDCFYSVYSISSVVFVFYVGFLQLDRDLVLKVPSVLFIIVKAYFMKECTELIQCNIFVSKTKLS